MGSTSGLSLLRQILRMPTVTFLPLSPSTNRELQKELEIVQRQRDILKSYEMFSGLQLDF
jgi:hypothetical protein